MSKDFNAFLADHEIKQQCTMPYTTQQNGVIERKKWSLMEMARCMVKCKLELVHKRVGGPMQTY